MPNRDQRLERLERRVRRQRQWNLTLASVLLLGGLMAANRSVDVPDLVRARAFEVVGKGDTALVRLGSSEDGAGRVAVSGGDGTVVASLDASKKTTGLRVLDPAGHALAWVGVHGQLEGPGAGSLSLQTTKGVMVANLGGGEFMGSALSLFYGNGDPACLVFFADNGVEFALFEKKGFLDAGVALGLDANGGVFRLRGHGTDAKGGVQMQVDETGSGVLKVTDDQGAPRLSVPRETKKP